MSNIITITLNPAFDVFYMTSKFELCKENLITDVNKTVGGKGINVSKALKGNGIDNTAICILPKDGAEEIKSELNRLDINGKYVIADGRVRENITIETESGEETRIAVNTFFSKKDSLYSVLNLISDITTKDSIIVLSGKFPKGLSKEDISDFVLNLSNITKKLIIDSASIPVDTVIKASPWLIKPNEQEITLFGDFDKLEVAATKIHSLGIKNVFITLGKDGAIFCSNEGLYKVEIPTIKPISTVGAGDATIAGFIYADCKEYDMGEKLKTACAFGTSACLEEGTDAPKKSNIDYYKSLTKITKITL